MSLARKCRFCSLLILVWLACSRSYCLGVADADSKPPTPNLKAGPYCGLYCLYSEARLNGLNVPFDFFLNVKYISGREGSSLSDLLQLAGDVGMNAAAFENMSLRALKKLPCHAILLVRNDAYISRSYDHYVLYLGEKSGNASILDPPNPCEEIPLASLASLWSGAGILVSRQPINSSGIFGFTSDTLLMLTVVLVFLAALLTGAGLKLLRPARFGRRLLKHGAEAAAIAVTTSVVAVGFHAFALDGLIRNKNESDVVRELYYPSNLDYVAFQEVRKLYEGKDVTIIDARRLSDYRNGHIPGAINIPITDSSQENIQRCLNSEPKSRRVVVYCQSGGCPYASIVARRLKNYCGYSNIMIYNEGWVEWSRKGFPIEKTTGSET
jgi:rhodanese-related sulfurtransferase